jgi:hypothetical protein
MQGVIGRRGLIVAGPLLVAGCTAPQVAEQRHYRGPPLRRPERIYVVQLGVQPGDVKLDSGVRERLMRSVSAQSDADARIAAGRQAAGAVAQETAAKLRDYGLPAEHVVGVPAPLPGPTVLVEGHVLSVDQGNRTQRSVVGFGRGQSSVVIEVQVYYREGAGAPRLIDTFEANAASAPMPGAVGTMGGGLVVGRLAESAAAAGVLRGVSEARSADTGAEGRRIGDALALRLGQLFADLGWVPRAVVA